MKALVTGGAGFIGSHVVDALLQLGHSVTVVDNLSSGKMENLDGAKDYRMALCDIRNVWELSKVFTEERPEVVFHLAAQPSIVASLDSPFIDLATNGMGTLNVIHAAEKAGTRRIVFASTSAVYPPNARICEEALSPSPASPYGVSKMAAENYLRLFEKATILRLGNVYGPRQVPLGENQVIPRMIRHLMFGDEFFIHGNGIQVRDYVYVEDVAQAFLKAALQEDFYTYNIGTGRQSSVIYLTELLGEIFNLNGHVWQHDELQDPNRSVNLSVTKARYLLGWTAQVKLMDGMQKTVEWWKGKEKAISDVKK